MEDLKTPVFKNYKEKQYFFRTLKRSFMRTEKVKESSETFRYVRNRFIANTLPKEHPMYLLNPYYETQLTNNK